MKAPPRWPSKGQARLLRLLEGKTRRAVGAVLGVSPVTIGRWAAGSSTPALYRHRRALERYLVIPADSWDEPPDAPNVQPCSPAGRTMAE